MIGYSWSTPGFSGAAGTGATTGTLTASNKAENVEVSCTLTIEYKVTIEGQEITRSTTKVVKSNVSIADKLLPGDITTVTFNGRTYSVTDGAVNISLLDKETIASADNKWSAAATGYVIDNTTNKPTYSDSTHKLTVKTTATTPLSTEITVTTTAATVTAKASLTEVISGGKTTLTASSNGLSNAATYAWFYKIGDSKEFPIGTGKSPSTGRSPQTLRPRPITLFTARQARAISSLRRVTPSRSRAFPIPIPSLSSPQALR